jgi:aspartyl-tRNA(Asn)/glutamyl-tRNA(Gln) amidotransferase subunit A
MGAETPTIVKASRMIRRGELTPVELLEMSLARIKQLEPEVEAWVTIDEAGATATAKKLTKEAAIGQIRSPLHGITVGVKDIFYTRGLKTTMGSPLYAGYLPDFDAAVVTQLRELGAIILGKTHTTEFASHDPAPTRNPWNTAHTPGGSSSGSAAAVAAGMIPLAIGTQTGGSVTRPAAYCGVVGVKPTYGLLSLDGVYPFSWSLDHVGLFTRNVEDAAMTLSLLTDQKAVRRLKAPPRIGVPDRFFNEKADRDSFEAYTKAVNLLERTGAEVVPFKLPSCFDLAPSIHRVIMSAEAAAVHERLFKASAESYRPYIRGQVTSGLLIRAATYIKAQRMTKQYRRDMEEAIKPFDAVATPSTTSSAPKGLEWTGDPALNSPWSLGGFPTITIPNSLSDKGLPLGLQLASPSDTDGALLSVARWCEGRLKFRGVPATHY